MTYQTLKQALKTNQEPTVVSITEVEVNGSIRNLLKVKKARGNNFYSVTQYENGRFSTAV